VDNYVEFIEGACDAANAGDDQRAVELLVLAAERVDPSRFHHLVKLCIRLSGTPGYGLNPDQMTRLLAVAHKAAAAAEAAAQEAIAPKPGAAAAARRASGMAPSDWLDSPPRKIEEREPEATKTKAISPDDYAAD